MSSKTATVEIDEQGRCTIPVEVRKALGFKDESVITEIEVRYDE
jgi:bifunctional DNA-binding transcriptional regulator/antitoxin component of YhaV-PrlF toxin-antitoxin module